MEGSGTSQLYYELSKKITSVYFSNNRFKLKNDCVCRLVAEAFPEVSSVSILLYESKRDSLINFGHYLDVDKSETIFSYESKIPKFILKNISLYEYFVSKREASSIKTCSFNDYKSSPYFYSEFYFDFNNERKKMDKEKFDVLKNEFFSELSVNDNSKYRTYKSYKIGISNDDKYDLTNPTTISGKYFKALISRDLSDQERKFIITSSYEIGTSNKILNKVYEDNFLIKIGANYNYFSIPLHVNGRYIGIIRFLLFPEDNKIITVDNHENVKAALAEKIDKKEFKSLQELSDMIALHIGNDFYNYGFKKAARSNLLNYKAYEDLYSEAINSKACIIRSSENKEKNVEIKGWTDSVESYIKKMGQNEEDHFVKNKGTLAELFKSITINNKELEIIAIQFEISPSGVEKIKYYYFSRDEVVRTATGYFDNRRADQSKLEKIFENRVIESLIELNISEVLLIKIPYVEHSYTSFANTIYRKFISNDLDLIYPQINRLGSELFIQQSKSERQKSELLANLYHALELPVQLAKSKVDQIKTYINRLLEKDEALILQELIYLKTNPKSRLKTLNEFEHLIKFIDFHFVLLRIKRSVDSNNEYPQLQKEYSFKNTMETYIDIHREFANDRRKIELIKDWDDFRDVPIHHNEMLFLGIFLCLIENALKYSFNETQRKKFIPTYSQDFSLKSDGHIKIKLFRSQTDYGYSITNWGKEIPQEYIKNRIIFNPQIRCPPDPDFEDINKPVAGEGRGLYYSNRLIEMSNGKIKIESIEKKTKITVSWKLEKK